MRLYQQRVFREAAGDEFRPGGTELTRELADACALRPGERVLDLGCGVGSSASILRHRYRVEAYGLDDSHQFIQEACARDADVTWVVGSAFALPFTDQFFSAVFCECFLSLFGRPAMVLREVTRVMAPGGRLAVGDMYLRNPEARRLPGRPPEGGCLHAALSLEELCALVEGAGFEVTTCVDRSSVLPAFMASLIFAYGSAERFWDAAVEDRQAQDGLQAGWIEAVRPGYCLLVARLP